MAKKKVEEVVEQPHVDAWITERLDLDPNDPRNRDYGTGELPSLDEVVEE